MYTDLESKARELYDKGYRPDDSLLGAIFGVDADADTKKAVNDSAGFFDDTITYGEAREINEIIRQNASIWQQEEEDAIYRSFKQPTTYSEPKSEYSSLGEFIVMIYQAVHYMAVEMDDPDYAKDATAHMGLMRLVNPKKGQTMQERVQREFTRTYLGRYWMLVCLVLLFLPTFIPTLLYALEYEAVTTLWVFLGIDALCSISFLSQVFNKGWSSVTCIKEGYDMLKKRVADVNEYKRFGWLSVSKAALMIIMMWHSLSIDGDVYMFIPSAVAFVLTIVWYMVADWILRKPTVYSKIKRLDDNKIREIYETEILPAVEQEVDLKDAKKKAWKKVWRHVLVTVIALLCASWIGVLIMQASTIKEKWNSFWYDVNYTVSNVFEPKDDANVSEDDGEDMLGDEASSEMDYNAAFGKADKEESKQLAEQFLKSNLHFADFGFYDTASEDNEGTAANFLLTTFEASELPHPEVGTLYANIEYMSPGGSYVFGKKVSINDKPGQEQWLQLFVSEMGDYASDSDGKTKFRVYYSWECEGTEEYGLMLEVALGYWDTYKNLNNYLRNRGFYGDAYSDALAVKDLISVTINGGTVTFPCSYQRFTEVTGLTVSEEDVAGYLQWGEDGNCSAYYGDKCVATVYLCWDAGATHYSEATVMGINLRPGKGEMSENLNWSYAGLDAKASTDEVKALFAEIYSEYEDEQSGYYEFELYEDYIPEYNRLLSVSYTNGKMDMFSIVNDIRDVE